MSQRFEFSTTISNHLSGYDFCIRNEIPAFLLPVPLIGREMY